MTFRAIVVGLCVLLPTAGYSKPIITSSETTYARICLAADEPLDRLLVACDSALAVPNLTDLQRAELLSARGDVLSWMDDDEAARLAFHEALAINPDLVTALNGLGWSERVLSGDEAAHDLFASSLAIEPSSEALAGLASTGRALGRLDNGRVVELLQAALAIDPQYDWAENELAWVYFRASDYQQADRHFAAVLERDGADGGALLGRGRVAIADGRPEDALNWLEQVHPEAYEIYSARLYRVVALRELDRGAQALREARRLSADYPQSVAPYVQIARAQIHLGRRAEALRTYASAEQDLGGSNLLYYWYADALSDDGRMEEALGIIDKGIAYTGGDASDHLLKSYIALELKDYPAARGAAEEVLKRDDSEPWAYYYIAIADVHGGKVESGLALFATAMDLGLPSHRVGGFAKELISAGNYVEAIQLRLDY